MTNKIKICLTGGGTAGHVMPHFALLPELTSRHYDPFYIGGRGIEEELIKATSMPFHRISAGKLRRYFSLENFIDIFKVATGFVQALLILRSQRPALVFSKGGFVSVPVALAAWILDIPVVTHESDLTPGLATKIISRIAAKVIYAFPETKPYLPRDAELVGIPVRAELLKGKPIAGQKLCGFDEAVHQQPVILVTGGSLGALSLNRLVETTLPQLLEQYYVIHLTGRGKQFEFDHPRYKSFSYVKDELPNLLALATIVVARAGANTIFEMLALHKPMLLVPLKVGSRGDQVLNAESFEKSGWSKTLLQEDPSSFLEGIATLFEERPAIIARQQSAVVGDAAEAICNVLDTHAHQHR